MTEHPLFFRPEMVRAILAGRKTRTCRLDWRAYERDDLLWVRENVRAEELDSGLDGVRYLADGAFLSVPDSEAGAEAWWRLRHYARGEGRTVPSVHMPRWASRISLRVVCCAYRLLRDMSRDDAMAEGCLKESCEPSAAFPLERGYTLFDGPPPKKLSPHPVGAFAAYWDSLCRKPLFRWRKNPVVQIVWFRVDYVETEELTFL